MQIKYFLGFAGHTFAVATTQPSFLVSTEAPETSPKQMDVDCSHKTWFAFSFVPSLDTANSWNSIQNIIYNHKNLF